MVTEQPQYSVDVCIFQTLQNTEISLIPNGLRFIFTYLLLLTFAITFHVARHTFATFALANGVSIESVAKMLGHANVQMTRHYARVLDRTVIREMSQIKMDFHFPFNKDDSSVIVE